MSIALLLPLGLAALAGLLVPLLIHLVRQSEHRIVDFPALRWLRESARPRRRLRFDDLWLLATRLLLLSLIALLLAVPVLNGDWRGPRHWVVLAPGIDARTARAQVEDADAEWRWLSAGFPALDVAVPRQSGDFSSLLRELDAILPADDQLSVIVAETVDDLDAQRIETSRTVDWHSAPAITKADTPAATPIPRTLALRHAEKNSGGLRYMRAALEAWKANPTWSWQVDDQPLATPLPEKTDAVIWLDAPLTDELRRWIRQGGRALVVDEQAGQGSIAWRDESGAVIARDEKLGDGHLIHLRGPLTPSAFPALLDADFPQRLQNLLAAALPAPSRAYPEQAKPLLATGPLTRLQQHFDLIPWLGVLISLVFLLERLLATRRQLRS